VGWTTPSTAVTIRSFSLVFKTPGFRLFAPWGETPDGAAPEAASRFGRLRPRYFPIFAVGSSLPVIFPKRVDRIGVAPTPRPEISLGPPQTTPIVAPPL